MKLGAVLLLLAASATPAWAEDERTMFASVGGTAGVGGSGDTEDDFDDPEPRGVLLGRAFVTWDLPPLAYPEPRGHRWAGGVAPEVVIGRLQIVDDRADGEDDVANFVAIGGRLEVRFSQRRLGLLELSGRGGVYVAGRAGLLDRERTPLAELAIGEYLYAGDSVRVGLEFGLLVLAGERTKAPDAPLVPRPDARGPWADGQGPYYAAVVSAYLGVKL